MRVEADDAGGDARQNRLGEAPAAIDQIARGGEPVVLAAQFGGHGVEGAPEKGEIALPVPHRDLNVEIACGDLLRRPDQPADRRHQAVGGAQPEPDRGEQDDQGEDRQHGREGDLDAVRDLLEDAIIVHRGLGFGRKVECAAVDEAGHEQDATAIGLELQDRAQDRVLARHEAERVLRVGVGEILGSRHFEAGDRDVDDLLDDGAVRLDDHRHRKAEEDRARAHEIAEDGRVGVVEHLGAVEVARHQRRLAGERAALQLAIFVRDLDRVLQKAVDPAREPRLEPPRQGDGSDRGDDDDRDRRDAAEQEHEAQVQPRTRRAGAPRSQQPARLDAHQEAEREDEAEIDDERVDRHPVGRLDGGEARQDQEARQRRHERRDDQDQTEPAGSRRCDLLVRIDRAARLVQRLASSHHGGCDPPGPAADAFAQQCGETNTLCDAGRKGPRTPKPSTRRAERGP